MREKHPLYLLGILLIFMSCSNESEPEEPVSKCGVPTTENYIVGEVDSECVFVEQGGDWINKPIEISGYFECGKFLNSNFTRYNPGMAYRVMLSIPFSGRNCPELSPDAIKIGRYGFLDHEYSRLEPGLASFAVHTETKTLGSWAPDLDQNSEAYFEVISVEDVPKDPSWPNSTYYKRVTGKVTCLIKNMTQPEEPIEVNDLEFSVYMIY